jgi:hypothetical protein
MHARNLRIASFALLLSVCILTEAQAAFPHTHGMWVWNSERILASPAETNRLVNGLIASGATDMFLYLTREQYVVQQASLRSLVGTLRRFGIASWGLEGYRGYFSDVYGPADLYAAVNALLAFNRAVRPEERFVGFQCDLEPQDGQGVGPNAFTNGKSYSGLTTEQKKRRDALMSDWVSIYTMLRSTTKAAGLRFGAAFPSWVDDYYGEPVTVPTLSGRRPLLHVMIGLVDDYVVMSYNVDPRNAANRVLGELAYASSLKARLNVRGPMVHAAVETHKGVGPTVSYGDHPVKNTKAAVVNDLDMLHQHLSGYAAFAGIAIHDWEGWRKLDPPSTSTGAPRAISRTSRPSATGWWPQ